MDDLTRHRPPAPPASAAASSLPGRREGESLADVLDRVLDKGVVVAGDIRINLLDIELLTIKIRLLIASADKAREMGIDWWAHDPQLNSNARRQQQKLDADRENKQLRERIEELESRLNELTERALPPAQSAGRGARGGAGHGAAHR